MNTPRHEPRSAAVSAAASVVSPLEAIRGGTPRELAGEDACTTGALQGFNARTVAKNSPRKLRRTTCRKTFLRAGLAAVALLCVMETARAQAIFGTVKTVFGAPIQGVSVRATRTTFPFDRFTGTTDSSGDYVVGSGLNGNFDVEAIEPGYTFTPTTANVTVSGSSTMVNFTTAVPEPTTGSAVLRATSATLHGRVNPNGSATAAWFQYGVTTSYGSVSAFTNIGNGINGVLFDITVSNLLNTTTYHYRVVASNSFGTWAGDDEIFTTFTGIPTVTTLVPTGGDATGMTLNGAAYPNGANANGWFEWGPTTNYGSLTAPQSLGDGVTQTNFSQALAGLATAATYHYRAVAMTSFATNYGADVSFIPLFSSVAFGLPPVLFSSGAWGDYDNDGQLDILVTGQANSGQRISQIWRNTGSGFTDINAGLTPVDLGSGAWGDYDNDGHLDILLTGRINQSNQVSQVWRNTASGFTNIEAGLPGVYQSSAAWGDYDKDGRLDILLIGRTNYLSGTAGISQVWRNTGGGFTNINAGLPGVSYSAAAWGDYDNDGRLDILLTGTTNVGVPTGGIAEVWRNTGSGFTNIDAGLPGVYWGSVAWGDYDNDGRLDILLTGYNGSAGVSQLWRNTASGFTNIDAGLPGVFQSSVAWGDYDKDGRLDFLLTGSLKSELWRNIGSGFTRVNIGLTGVSDGSVAWADYDNDGRLDMLLTGRTNTFAGAATSQLWRNNTPITTPTPPAGLVSWWWAENNTLDSQGVNHGTAQDTVNYAPGAIGQGFSLAGSGYINVANPTLSVYTNAFTIAGWFVIDNLSAQPSILDFRNFGNNEGFVLAQDASGNITFHIFKASQGGAFTVLTATGWQLDTPYHIAATFDGSTMTIYRNGNVVAARTDSGDTVRTVTNPVLQIGRNVNNGSLWNGQIDEVQFYGRALTQAEVASLMYLVHKPTPMLIISSVDNAHARITWPTNAADYTLEFTTALPASMWTTVTDSAAIIGDRFALTVDTSVGSRFYRLHKP